MKNNYILTFLLIFVLSFLVLPPIVFQFFAERQKEFFVHYPISVFLTGIFSFLIYYYSIKGRIFKSKILHEKTAFFVYSSNTMICFGILCLSTVIFEGISYYLNYNPGIQQVIFPQNTIGFINFIFGVIFSAFSEEVIYRFFLPLAFKEILSKKLTVYPKLWLFYEGLSLILFALGHLYLGIFGFMNALVCGFALRFCMIKTKTIWISFIIHLAYNLFSFGTIYLILK